MMRRGASHGHADADRSHRGGQAHGDGGPSDTPERLVPRSDGVFLVAVLGRGDHVGTFRSGSGMCDRFVSMEPSHRTSHGATWGPTVRLL